MQKLLTIFSTKNIEILTKHYLTRLLVLNNRALVSEWIYDTSSNDTSSTEPFLRKGFLSKCHFVECPLRRNRFWSNTVDEIFNAHLAAIS